MTSGATKGGTTTLGERSPRAWLGRQESQAACTRAPAPLLCIAINKAPHEFACMHGHARATQYLVKLFRAHVRTPGEAKVDKHPLAQEVLVGDRLA